MFALVRGLISLVIFGIVIWFAVTVPIGKRTLWGHLRAIAATPEARELAEGTKEEALRVAERLRGHPEADAGPPAPKAGQPLEQVDEQDRRGLDELVKRPPPPPARPARPAKPHAPAAHR